MKAQGVRTIALADIDASGRLRAVDEGQAMLLAENIRECGRMHQPIEVRAVKGGRFKLIAGGHRLRAAEILGWTEVEAFVRRTSADKARMMEIDENLIRHDLNALDRAVFLAERKAVYEALYPETKNGGDHGNQHTSGKPRQNCTISGFAADTAARCGIDKSTVSRAVRIAVQLPPDIRARLSGSRIARKQAELLALVKVPPERRHAVVDLLLNQPTAVRSVRAAVRRLDGGDLVSDDRMKKLTALRKAWDGASRADRLAFLTYLRGEPGFERFLGDIAQIGASAGRLARVA